MKLDIGNVLAGVGTLIAAYLLLTNASNFNSIIKTGGSFTLSAIQTLQGRSGFLGTPLSTNVGG